MPCAPSIPRGRRGPPEELPCAPPALRLHARFLEPWKQQRPWRPTPARPSARMAAPAAPASMDAPGHSTRPPFSRRRPQPSPTPTRIPRVVPRLTREGWLEGPLELWSRRATELLQRPVQRRWVTTLPPMVTCKAHTGTLRPAPSRRRSSETRTLDCSGSRPRIDNSLGYSATQSISTMAPAPTSMVGSVSTKTHDGSGFTPASPRVPSHCTTSPTVDGLIASCRC